MTFLLPIPQLSLARFNSSHEMDELIPLIERKNITPISSLIATSHTRRIFVKNVGGDRFDYFGAR